MTCAGNLQLGSQHGPSARGCNESFACAWIRSYVRKLTVGSNTDSRCMPKLGLQAFESLDSCASKALPNREHCVLKAHQACCSDEQPHIRSTSCSFQRSPYVKITQITPHKGAAETAANLRTGRSVPIQRALRSHLYQYLRLQISESQDISCLILLQARIYLYTSTRRPSAFPLRLARLRRSPRL